MRVFSLSLALLFITSCKCSGGSVSDQSIKQKVLTMAAQVDDSFDTPTISVLDLKNELKGENKKDLILVDVREEKEQETSMIKGAMTFDEFNGNIEKFKSKKIVLYCTIGARSAQVSKTLRKKGLNSYSLSGSILMWIHEGGALVDQNGETKRVHVYGNKWDLLPKGYSGVTQ